MCSRSLLHVHSFQQQPPTLHWYPAVSLRAFDIISGYISRVIRARPGRLILGMVPLLPYTGPGVAFQFLDISHNMPSLRLTARGSFSLLTSRPALSCFPGPRLLLFLFLRRRFPPPPDTPCLVSLMAVL